MQLKLSTLIIIILVIFAVYWYGGNGSNNGSNANTNNGNNGSNANSNGNGVIAETPIDNDYVEYSLENEMNETNIEPFLFDNEPLETPLENPQQPHALQPAEAPMF